MYYKIFLILLAGAALTNCQKKSDDGKRSPGKPTTEETASQPSQVETPEETPSPVVTGVKTPEEVVVADETENTDPQPTLEEPEPEPITSLDYNYINSQKTLTQSTLSQAKQQLLSENFANEYDGHKLWLIGSDYTQTDGACQSFLDIDSRNLTYKRLFICEDQGSSELKVDVEMGMIVGMENGYFKLQAVLSSCIDNNYQYLANASYQQSYWVQVTEQLEQFNPNAGKVKLFHSKKNKSLSYQPGMVNNAGTIYCDEFEMDYNIRFEKEEGIEKPASIKRACQIMRLGFAEVKNLQNTICLSDSLNDSWYTDSQVKIFQNYKN